MKNHIILTAIIASAATVAHGDHGPGTSASGFNTQTAETLKARQIAGAVTFDWTEFDTPGLGALIGKDHFDLIDRSYLTTFGFSLGVTENLQLGLSFGYYAADGARQIVHDEGGGEHGEAPAEGEHHEEAPAAPTLATFEPDGWTDLWLTAKYRIHRGPAGSFSLLGGVKFPVGETRVINSAGERVEPASTPGTGAWDGMAGLAYTLPLTPSLTLDASAQYTIRGEKYDYRLGNRLDAGAALAWRIAGGKDQFPSVHLIGEATVRHVAKSKESGERDGNTGGTALFLSPGVRVGFGEHAAWNVGVQFPVAQELNGDQVETDFRLTTSVNFAF